jgi:hypothetical protein
VEQNNVGGDMSDDSFDSPELRNVKKSERSLVNNRASDSDAFDREQHAVEVAAPEGEDTELGDELTENEPGNGSGSSDNDF